MGIDDDNTGVPHSSSSVHALDRAVATCAGQGGLPVPVREQTAAVKNCLTSDIAWSPHAEERAPMQSKHQGAKGGFALSQKGRRPQSGSPVCHVITGIRASMMGWTEGAPLTRGIGPLCGRGLRCCLTGVLATTQ